MAERGDQRQQIFCLFSDSIQSVGDIPAHNNEPGQPDRWVFRVRTYPSSRVCETRLTKHTLNPSQVQQKSQSIIKNYFIILVKGKLLKS